MGQGSTFSVSLRVGGRNTFACYPCSVSRLRAAPERHPVPATAVRDFNLTAFCLGWIDAGQVVYDLLRYQLAIDF
jgi:hypothetical protein